MVKDSWFEKGSVVEREPECLKFNYFIFSMIIKSLKKGLKRPHGCIIFDFSKKFSVSDSRAKNKACLMILPGRKGSSKFDGKFSFYVFDRGLRGM